MARMEEFKDEVQGFMLLIAQDNIAYDMEDILQ